MPYTLRGEIRKIYIATSTGSLGGRMPHGEFSISGWNEIARHAVVVGSRYILKHGNGRRRIVIVTAVKGDTIRFRYPGNRAWASNTGNTNGNMVDAGKR